MAKVLYLLWWPYRKWYTSLLFCLPRKVERWAGTGLKALSWLVSSPWRLLRKRREAALLGSGPKDPWFTVSCRTCGFVGSSEDLLGGESTMDGDYSPVLCPGCLSPERRLEGF